MPWAVSCDGEDDYIDLGKLGNLGRNVGTAKISVTFKTPKNYAPGYFTSLYGTLNDGSNGFNIMVRLNAERYLPNPITYAPGKTFFYTRTGPGQIIGCHINEPALYDGEYHKLTVDYTDVRNSNLKIFIDEKPVQIQHYSHKTNITSSAENIQYSLNFGAYNSRGTIGLFSAITIANIEITISDQPHAKYPIDEGQGNIIHDISGNDFHGGIVGGAWVYESGEVPISATLCGSSSFRIGKPERVRGLSATLKGSSIITATPERIRGLDANLYAAPALSARAQLVASVGAKLYAGAYVQPQILVLHVPGGVYVIDAEEILERDHPVKSQMLANHIEVVIHHIAPAAEMEEVYKSEEPITLGAGETKTVSVFYSEKPVIQAVAKLENITGSAVITGTKYYAWGANVTIAGIQAGQVDLVVDGRPLRETGAETVVYKDDQSILENGIKKYTFDNPLVQTRAIADKIGPHLLKFAIPRADIKIRWRGDPSLVPGDPILVPEYQRGMIDQRGVYFITQQEIAGEGGIEAVTEGRKL